MSTIQYLVLINGGISETFSPGRGLRQGDPLSPYLFILCSEFITRLLNKEESQGNIHGIKVSKGGPAISHLMYADDLLLMCKANNQEARAVKRCLDAYYG